MNRSNAAVFVQYLIWGWQRNGTKVPFPLAEKVLCSLVHFRARRAGAAVQGRDTAEHLGHSWSTPQDEGQGCRRQSKSRAEEEDGGTKLQVTVVLISFFFSFFLFFILFFSPVAIILLGCCSSTLRRLMEFGSTLAAWDPTGIRVEDFDISGKANKLLKMANVWMGLNLTKM